MSGTIRDVEAALFGLTVTDIILAENERIKGLARELERVQRLIRTEIWTRERDARAAFNTDPTDGNDGERAIARNIQRRLMDAA